MERNHVGISNLALLPYIGLLAHGIANLKLKNALQERLKICKKKYKIVIKIGFNGNLPLSQKEPNLKPNLSEKEI